MATLQRQSPEPGSAPTFESTPWLAADRTVEEPRRAPEPALLLENDDHVIELEESDSIRRAD
jgi:hypothetical protein